MPVALYYGMSIPVAGMGEVFGNPTLQSLKLTMQGAQAKHQAIASNIANVNTPGYKRLDVQQSFKMQLQSNLKALASGNEVSELPKAIIGEAAEQGPARYDGNTVQMESELLDLLDNKTRYEFAAQMISKHFSGMKRAISGGQR